MKPILLLACVAFVSSAAHAQPLDSCVPASEGTAFTVSAPGATEPVSGVVLGRGERAVVFSNTAYNAPCDWLPVARELAAAGHQVALWSYRHGDLQGQLADLNAVVAHVRAAGARRVALVGGSRGGCLSMIAASEAGPPAIAGVAILSCAAVFNRRDPTATAPWAAKLRVPVLHVTGENDTTPPLAEAKAEFALFPAADKRLVVVPATAAHGDQLLAVPAAAAIARPALLEFLARVLP
ncbi:MAG: hypothetical protein V4864_22980 [Pseudomonadota bacterium]